MFDKGLQPCVEELANKLTTAKLATSAAVGGRVSGKIASIDGSKIFINLGSQHGLKEEDTFDVCKTGAAIKDPDTGKVLGTEEKRIGTIRVVAVKGIKYSECSVVKGWGFTAGDVVK